MLNPCVCVYIYIHKVTPDSTNVDVYLASANFSSLQTKLCNSLLSSCYETEIFMEDLSMMVMFKLVKLVKQLNSGHGGYSRRLEECYRHQAAVGVV